MFSHYCPLSSVARSVSVLNLIVRVKIGLGGWRKFGWFGISLVFFKHLNFIGQLVNKPNQSVHVLHPISHHYDTAELAGVGVDVADKPANQER